MRKTILLIAITCAALGCGYATGNASYSQKPELRNVRLFSGRVDPQGENLGAVELALEGERDCTELAGRAMLELLHEAQALGGTGVKDVRFRGRFTWMGRIVCRRSLTGLSVQIRGMATR